MVFKELAPPARAFEGVVLHGAQSETDIRKYCDYLKVCVRWRRIYEPFFYHFPNLGSLWWDVPYTTSSLLATLQSRPDLRACVQRLEIRPRALPQGNEHNERNFVGIIQLCKPSVRSVLLHTDWDSDFAWLPIDALKGHHLHTLEIFGTRSVFGIQTFFNHLNSPTLRTLRLHQFTSLDIDVDDTPGIDRSVDDFRLSNGGPEYDLTGLAGRGSITSLTLNERAGDFQLTRPLIAWPERLVKLEWTGILGSSMSFSLDYSARDVQEILEGQRESLEEIILGVVVNGWDDCEGGSDEHIVTFSRFPKLRRLGIPHEFLSGLDPLTAMTCLNAPGLTRLDVEFHFGKSIRQNHAGGFGLTEKEWFITFARAMVANSSALPPISPAPTLVVPSITPPHSSCTEYAAESSSTPSFAKPSAEYRSTRGLRLITLQYVPDSMQDMWNSFLPRMSEKHSPWPWVHMEEAAKTLAPLGLQVDFEPSVTEGNWRVMAEGYEEIFTYLKDR